MLSWPCRRRIANRLDLLALDRPAPTASLSAQPTTEAVLADWRQRLSVTSDVWAVAVVIAPVLVERGDSRMKGRPQSELAAVPSDFDLYRPGRQPQVISFFGCSRIAATSASTLEPNSPSTSR